MSFTSHRDVIWGKHDAVEHHVAHIDLSWHSKGFYLKATTYEGQVVGLHIDVPDMAAVATDVTEKMLGLVPFFKQVGMWPPPDEPKDKC